MKFHLTKCGKSDVNLTYLSPNPLIIQDICVAFSLRVLHKAQYLANYQFKNITTRYAIYRILVQFTAATVSLSFSDITLAKLQN